MITANSIRRTFQIKTKKGLATCFTIEVDARQYVVTARHVLPKAPTGGKVHLLRDGKWEEVPVDWVGATSGEADVAVVAPRRQVSPTLPLVPSSDGIVLGQDAYFVGFPFGLRSDAPTLNDNYPIPLVKKGIVSCINPAKRAMHQILLDGHNNPGFSGGPVVFVPMGTSTYQVAAVVSGYRIQEDAVLVKGAKTGALVRSNSGIVITYGIQHAVDLIRGNPRGFLVT